MKRLAILAIAAALVLGAAMSAQAVEMNVTGTWDFNFGWTTSADGFDSFQDNQAPGARYGNNNSYINGSTGTEDKFDARQRVRTQIDFIASENVSGTLFFEIGDISWGNGNGSYAGGVRTGPNSGFALGTDGVNIKTRRAYIDFNIPNTELMFRVGLQGLAIPGAVADTPIIGYNGEDVAAILASYKINDMVTVAAFWARPYDVNNPTDPRNLGQNDEVDMIGLLVPITVPNVGSFTPYGLYGIFGTDAVAATAPAFTGLYTNALGTNIATAQNALLDSDYMYAWWLGTAIEITALDPLTFGLDVTWGTMIDNQRYMTRSGWYLAGKVAYKTPWVTPTLIGWWTSGDDSNIWNGSEKMPSISSGFNATTFGYGGGDAMGRFNTTLADPNQNNATAAGTWGLALQFNNISFVEDLTHQIIVAYVGGTNSPRSMRDTRAALVPWSPYFNNMNNTVLTTSDHLWEVDFNTKYQLYENLAVFMETGMFNISRAAGPWRQPENRPNDPSYNNAVVKLYDNSTAWKLMFGLQYKF